MKLIALLSLSLSFTTAAGAQVWSRSVSGLGKTDVVRSVESGTGGELALALDPGVGGPCVVVITKEGATGRTRCFEAGDSREYVVPLANGYLRYGTVYLDVSQPGLGKSRKGDGFATLLDRELNVVWSRHMEGSESITLTTAAATPDNGYVLAGTSGAASLVIKLRSDGALQWRRRYDLSETDRINRIEAAADGSLLAAGTGRGHPWLMKLDSQGGVAWHFMSTVEGAALSMAVQAGGAVAIAGHAERAGRLYPWIASFDHGGTVRWQKMADRPGVLYKVFFHRDGSLVALGSSSVDLLEILSFAGSGELQWQRGLRLPSQSIATMTENGLVVASPVKTGLEVRRLDRKVAGDACANLLAVEVSYTFTPIKGTTSYDLDRTGIEITATPVADRGRSIPISLMKATCEPAAVAAEPTKSTVILTTSERMLLRHHAEAEALSGKARELLSKRQFSALDEWADQLRRSGETFGDGYSKLSEFYHGLTREEVGQSETEHLDLLHRWRSEAPRSAAGAVATAEALLAYAHRARGSSTAGLVSETGRRRQAELLDAAARVLEGSAEFALADPHYWVARIQLAGVSCDGLDAVVRSAAVREKRFPYIFRAASIFYLPRWCGSAAEFRGFAEFAADATKAEFGDALYALVAWTALSIEDSNALTTFGLDWNRVQRGFEDYLRRYPDATSWHHRYAYAAWRASDRARARKLFATPHLGWTQEFHTIWRSHGDYMVARNWAMSEPTEDIMRSPSPVANTPPIAARPEPAPQPPSSSSSLRRPAANSWITGAASSWPPLFMTNRLELRDGTVVARFNSFLVDTGDGVVAVTATPASSDRNQTDSPSLPGITVYPRPIAIADLRVEMKKWDMTVPPESKQKLTVSSIENMPARESRSLVLAVSSPGKDLPVRVLRPATKGGDPSGRVYIVACASSGSRCDQTVFTGQIRGRSVGTGRKFGYPQIILENEVPPENLTGSPVLNEDGLVVAVMLGESRGGMMVGSAQVATHAAEEIGLILENAGIWKP